jgi:hypothetical protein
MARLFDNCHFKFLQLYSTLSEAEGSRDAVYDLCAGNQGWIKGRAIRAAARGTNLKGALKYHWNKSEIC